MKDPVVTMFFTAIPLAQILCAIMDGTYENPDYKKWLKEQREIEGARFFKRLKEQREIEGARFLRGLKNEEV